MALRFPLGTPQSRHGMAVSDEDTIGLVPAFPRLAPRKRAFVPKALVHGSGQGKMDQPVRVGVVELRLEGILCTARTAPNHSCANSVS